MEDGKTGRMEMRPVCIVKRFSKKITTSRAGGIEKSFSFKLMERSE